MPGHSAVARFTPSWDHLHSATGHLWTLTFYAPGPSIGKLVSTDIHAPRVSGWPSRLHGCSEGDALTPVAYTPRHGSTGYGD